MIRQLPAGLIDDRFELFADPVNLEKAYCLCGGQVTRVSNAPSRVKHIIAHDMAKYPTKQDWLTKLGYLQPDERLEKYSSCVFGAYDGEADMVDGQLVHTEFWLCPKRSICPATDQLCNPLRLPNGILSNRQIEVLQLIGQCLLNKEIAQKLQISIETVKIHIKNIQEKSGLMNKKDLVKLAYQKNLI